MTPRLKSFIAGQGGYTTTQAAYAFAALGIVAAVFVTPMLNTGPRTIDMAGLDRSQYDLTTTASTASPRRDRRVKISRSVLQPKGSLGCVIYDSGRREGDC